VVVTAWSSTGRFAVERDLQFRAEKRLSAYVRETQLIGRGVV